jgi:hypothetical protein
MEENGIVVELTDIRLKNYNPVSIYGRARDKPKRRTSTDGEGSERSSSEGDSSSSDDNDVEELEDYHTDGYHPAHVGEVIDSKYVILKKLGWGHFSTVWLAFKLSDKQLYALKIQKSAEKYIESAFEEEEILFDVASNFKDPKW